MKNILINTFHFVDLRSGHILTGFTDFESAFAASEELTSRGFRVSYLNETTHVQNGEVMMYLKTYTAADTKQYQNYHYPNREFGKQSPKESLKTAIEVLEAKANYKIKFMMVLTPLTVKVSLPQNKVAAVK